VDTDHASWKPKTGKSRERCQNKNWAMENRKEKSRGGDEKAKR